MKLFTTAAAIDLLKPTFEITTTVYVRGNIEPSGTLDGDVKIVGHGDPTIGGRFHDGQATAVIQEWATDLQRAGIKTVRGNLIFEYGYFDTEYIHPTWPVDQLVNWYEAPISAFSMQEGCVQVRVLPAEPGRECVVQLEPPTEFLDVENSCVDRTRSAVHHAPAQLEHGHRARRRAGPIGADRSVRDGRGSDPLLRDGHGGDVHPQRLEDGGADRRSLRAIRAATGVPSRSTPRRSTSSSTSSTRRARTTTPNSS